jgi:hypothetical protein
MQHMPQLQLHCARQTSSMKEANWIYHMQHCFVVWLHSAVKASLFQQVAHIKHTIPNGLAALGN